MNRKALKESLSNQAKDLIEEQWPEIMAAYDRNLLEHDVAKPFVFRFGTASEIEGMAGGARAKTTLSFSTRHKAHVEEEVSDTPDMFPGEQ